MNIFSHHTMFLLCDSPHMSNDKIVLHPTMMLISMYKGQSEFAF